MTKYSSRSAERLQIIAGEGLRFMRASREFEEVTYHIGNEKDAPTCKFLWTRERVFEGVRKRFDVTLGEVQDAVNILFESVLIYKMPGIPPAHVPDSFALTNAGEEMADKLLGIASMSSGFGGGKA